MVQITQILQTKCQMHFKNNKKIDSSLEIDGEMQGDSALSENIEIDTLVNHL